MINQTIRPRRLFMLNCSEVLLKTKVDCLRSKNPPVVKSKRGHDQVQWTTKITVETGPFLFLFTGHFKSGHLCAVCVLAMWRFETWAVWNVVGFRMRGLSTTTRRRIWVSRPLWITMVMCRWNMWLALKSQNLNDQRKWHEGVDMYWRAWRSVSHCLAVTCQKICNKTRYWLPRLLVVMLWVKICL